MTPKEVAIDLIKFCVLRGDDPHELKKTCLGSYSSDYCANIGGFINGKYCNDKIIIKKINGKECFYSFDFYKIYNEIKNGQQTLL